MSIRRVFSRPEVSITGPGKSSDVTQPDRTGWRCRSRSFAFSAMIAAGMGLMVPRPGAAAETAGRQQRLITTLHVPRHKVPGGYVAADLSCYDPPGNWSASGTTDVNGPPSAAFTASALGQGNGRQFHVCFSWHGIPLPISVIQRATGPLNEAALDIDAMKHCAPVWPGFDIGSVRRPMPKQT
jgi:hypothetical protein